jgi:peptidyl-prolyl cis-trans isomerase SurA
VNMIGSMKPGEYSQPTEFMGDAGKRGVHIVYLANRIPPHRENLKDDYNKIAQRALEEKKQAAIEAWFYKKLPTYYIMVDKEYQDCEGIKKAFYRIAKN